MSNKRIIRATYRPFLPKECPVLLDAIAGMYKCPECGVISGEILHPMAQGVLIGGQPKQDPVHSV